MKLLFLDIDGVLVGDDELRTILKDKAPPFNPIALSNLQHIFNYVPDLKIVISSTWRKGATIDELREIFRLRGFKYWQQVVDKTVVLSFEKLEDKDVEWYMTVPRGCEIEQYIRTHIPIVKYAILDDGSDMMYWQRNNFVYVQEGTLSFSDAENVIDILEAL